jgi:hypothetical protein
MKPSFPGLALLLFALPSGVGAVDFKKDIQPIFKQHCYECHSVEAGKEKAGYVFDDLETLKLDINPKGIIVPNEPTESYLLEVLMMDISAKAHMPPKKQLSDREISKVREWIASGAPLEAQPAGALAARPAAPQVVDWTNAEGVTIKAGFVRLDGDQVVMLLPTNRQEVKYPLEKLSAESQQLARKLAEGTP